MSEPVLDPTSGEVIFAEAQPEGDDCERCDYERRRADAEHRRADLIADDLARVEQKWKNELRNVGRLQAELDKQRMDAPEAPVVRAVYEKWVRLTGRNPKRTKLGPKREAAILARLREGRDGEYLLRALDGLPAANVDPRETQRLALLRALHEAVEMLDDAQARQVRAAYKDAMTEAVVYDELELVMRDEVYVEKFHRLAERIAPNPKQTS